MQTEKEDSYVVKMKAFIEIIIYGQNKKTRKMDSETLQANTKNTCGKILGAIGDYR